MRSVNGCADHDLRRSVVYALAAFLVGTWAVSCGDDAAEPNQAPTAVGTMPDQEASAGETATLDASGYFEDPDGDALSYEAASSDVSVATASASGSTISVVAVAKGTATITVTASDPDGLSAGQSFEVAVPNRGPLPVGEIPAQESTAGQTVTVDASGYFEDPDGDALSYEASVSDEGVVKVSASDATVAIEAEANGSATVTVRASDPEGLSAEQSFEVTVRPNPDRAALTALYQATGGPNWINNGNWLTDKPIGDWHGVRVEGGRVVELDLFENGLTGPIPSALGELSELRELILFGNQLTGPIPPELGELSEVRELNFFGNQLSGPIPPELAELSELRWLRLSSNTLTGPIPPQLGELSNLAGLVLFFNQLSGPIPPELGELSELVWLDLQSNSLTGRIPAELGRLSNLKGLSLSGNELTGAIPGELGELASLQSLRLARNRLTGAIPSQLGRLSNLSWLVLHGNEFSGPIPTELGELSNLYELELQESALTGPIPPQLGNLSTLTKLWLHGNALAGPIPPELGKLSNLSELRLQDNSLAGPVPPELGGMTELRALVLTNNGGMSGALPRELTALGELDALLAGGTDLCAPGDPTFLEWLGGVHKSRVASCGNEEGAPAAYLTQAVQSREYPVPLVAGEKVLLRVFVTARVATDAEIPPVRATFYVDGARAHVERIAGKPVSIATAVDEGDLSKSANAEIPGSVIRPGLEMVIEIDPESTLDAELGVAKRIPESGRLAVRVREMPSLDLTFIPFLWESDPDSAVLDIARDMAENPAEHDTLRHTRALLPVAGIAAEAHEAVVSSSNSAFSMLSQTRAIRVMEGGTGHYMGMMTGRTTGAFGVAAVPGRTSYSYPASQVIAHELGHNMNLEHAPCGGAFGPDPSFPQPDGSIGSWGYDFVKGELVSSATADLMSYCRPRWISDYYFANALRFRLSDDDHEALRSPASTQALLLWGGLSPEGEPFLEPALVVDAPPNLPRAGGEYELTGQAADGAELFSLTFDMAAVADAEGESGLFVFALPTRPGWAGSLASLTLSGPGGSVTLDEESDRPMAIFRDPRTKRVRAILRDLPPGLLDDLAARAPAPGLDIFWSRGIPHLAAWRR